MKTYATINIKEQEFWYRIYGSRAGQTLEISTPQKTPCCYCIKIPYNDILRGENETMKEYVTREIKNYNFIKEAKVWGRSNLTN